jgi:L-arabinonolactonase
MPLHARAERLGTGRDPLATGGAGALAMGEHIRFIGVERCGLGESPLWDPDARILYWIDSVTPRVWRHDSASGAQDSFPAPDRIGSIALGAPGQLIAGLTDGVYRIDLASRSFTPLSRPAELGGDERLNDGKTDRAGRLIIGSLATNPVLETGIEMSNAICFSPAGDRLYFADSLEQVVWCFDYDLASGAAVNRRNLIETSLIGGTPDGATVDADGFLWVALVLTQQIGRFAPDGTLERLIDAPCPFPTCPAFGGDGLDILYVTSIADSRGRLKSDHPDAGRLFAIEGLGVQGLAETRCRL